MASYKKNQTFKEINHSRSNSFKYILRFVNEKLCLRKVKRRSRPHIENEMIKCHSTVNTIYDDLSELSFLHSIVLKIITCRFYCSRIQIRRCVVYCVCKYDHKYQ